MSDPRGIEPDAFEIVAVRELRRAGLTVEAVKRAARARRDAATGDFAFELHAGLSAGGRGVKASIGCVRTREPVDAPRIERFAAAAAKAGRRGVLFSTAGFAPDAIDAAARLGIALLSVIDGRAAHARDGWSPRGQTPAWVPEHAAELVHAGDPGPTRSEPLAAGSAGRILDALSTVDEDGDRG